MSERAMISVTNVSKSFKLPHEKHSGLKSAILNFKPGKKYEMQYVLKDISFEIKEGEFFGIVGRNGSGKSTLLKLLAQIYTPDKGSVAVNGSLTPFIELGVGFNPELTGRENVFLNGALLGFDRKQVGEMYQDIVEFAEIEPFMDQKLKNYSSGMQVRLAFSIAIRAKSDILLIDEVLAVGDAAFQQKCFDYFEELKSKNTTVVLVTHDMEAVKRFCTRAVMIDQGEVVKIGSPMDVADLYVEENIAKIISEDAKTEVSAYSPISIEIISKSNDELSFEIYSETKNLGTDTYVGFSVIKDGITFAELNSSRNKSDVPLGRLAYTLDISQLNSGVYEIGAALFTMKSRKLLALTKKRCRFIVTGHDSTRGAMLKLPDVWH